MLFAHLKRIMKLDRLRLRGLTGATDEFTLAAMVQNLRRMAKGGADDFLDGLYGHQSDRMTILDGTTPAKRHFDAALVVPVDIGIDSRHEVFQRHVLPIPRVD